MDVVDFTGVGFVGLDVDAMVGIPEAYGMVFATTQIIGSLAVESRC